jgi:hypothetical protein
VPPQNHTEISPLFKCDSATLSFYASKDGKISVSFSGWDASKVVLEDQAFEVSWETYLGRAEDQAVEIMLNGGSPPIGVPGQTHS